MHRPVCQRTHTGIAHDGQPVQHIHLMRVNMLTVEHPVYEKPAPAIGKAVGKGADQPVERVGFRDEHLLLQGQAERANGKAFTQPAFIVFKCHKTPLVQRQCSDLSLANERFQYLIPFHL